MERMGEMQWMIRLIAEHFPEVKKNKKLKMRETCCFLGSSEAPYFTLVTLVIFQFLKHAELFCPPKDTTQAVPAYNVITLLFYHGRLLLILQPQWQFLWKFFCDHFLSKQSHFCYSSCSFLFISVDYDYCIDLSIYLFIIVSHGEGWDCIFTFSIVSCLGQFGLL